MCLICTILLACVSKLNNKRVQNRDKNVNKCCEEWNQKVFSEKGAVLKPGKLSAWIVQEIEDSDYERKDSE